MKHWNKRYMEMASLVASWSRDPSTKCGAVIVRPNNTIVSVGFNGFPRDVEDSDDRLNHRETKYKYVVHAELNAILNAREPLTGYSIDVHPFEPCSQCAAAIIQSGINTVYYPSGQTPENWEESVKITRQMFSEANIKFVNI